MSLNKKRLLEKYVFVKYADIDADTIKDSIATDIKSAIINASRSPVMGIMDFTKMLEVDGATLGLTIIKSNSFLHNTLQVLPATVNPPITQDKYAGLSTQVEGYLKKYPDLFPSYAGGESVSYDNFRIDLVFGV
jgi:hypothetical protein